MVVQKLLKMKAMQRIMMWTVSVLTLPKKFVRLKITQLLKKSTKPYPMRAAPMSAQWKKNPNISSAMWTHNFKLTKQQFLSFVKWQEVFKVFSLEVQSNLAIRNFLVALKLFLNAKSSLSLWNIKWQMVP